MNLELIILLGTKLSEEVYEVMMPTVAGEIAVFPGHEPLVTLAVPGAIAVRHHKGDVKLEYFAISGGVIEISPSRLRVLVDEAEHGEEIIEAQTRAALEHALQLQHNATSHIELEKAHQLVDRHAVRLKVADLHRRHHR